MGAATLLAMSMNRETTSTTPTMARPAPATQPGSVLFADNLQQASADLPALLQAWGTIQSEAEKVLSALHHGFTRPVEVVDDQIQIHQYAMIPGNSYVVAYKGERYEFVRTADDSIEVSDVLESKE
jgi:hypothetical protein